MKNTCNLLKCILNFETVKADKLLKAIIVQCGKTNKSHNVSHVKHERKKNCNLVTATRHIYIKGSIYFFFILKKEISLMKLLMMHSFSFYFF